MKSGLDLKGIERGVLKELVLANGSRILLPNRKAIQNSKGKYKKALTSRGWGAVSECGLLKALP